MWPSLGTLSRCPASLLPRRGIAPVGRGGAWSMFEIVVVVVVVVVSVAAVSWLMPLRFSTRVVPSGLFRRSSCWPLPLLLPKIFAALVIHIAGSRPRHTSPLNLPKRVVLHVTLVTNLATTQYRPAHEKSETRPGPAFLSEAIDSRNVLDRI